MIYNFEALDSSDDYYDDIDENTNINITDDQRKQAEIVRLQKIRDEKRKDLLELSKTQPMGENDHQDKIREMNKKALGLSREIEQKQILVAQLEQKIGQFQSVPIVKYETSVNENNEVLRSLRLQTDSLKTELNKAKRALSLEGGNLGRGNIIKKLKAQLQDCAIDVELENKPERTPHNQVDPNELKNEIQMLSDEHKNLKLKLKGLRSRVVFLEKSEIKSRVKANLAQSDHNDETIEILKPKKKNKEKKESYHAHIGQHSRLSVIIHGLHSELVSRLRDLNHHKITNSENGIHNEIEKLQKRLHLLESSLSCLV